MALALALAVLALEEVLLLDGVSPLTMHPAVLPLPFILGAVVKDVRALPVQIAAAKLPNILAAVAKVPLPLPAADKLTEARELLLSHDHCWRGKGMPLQLHLVVVP